MSSELQARLIKVIPKLCPEDDIRDEPDLPLLVAEIDRISRMKDWNALVNFLEEQAQIPGIVVMERP